MLIYDNHNREFRNHLSHLSAGHFCYELPNKGSYFCHQVGLLTAMYCTLSRAHAWFVCTHIFRQTLPMLIQLCFREIVQPFCPSLQRVGKIIALR